MQPSWSIFVGFPNSLLNHICQTLLLLMRSKSKPITIPQEFLCLSPINQSKQLNLPGYPSSWWVTLGVATLLVSQKNETRQEGNGHHLVDDTGQQTCCWQTQETIRTTCNIQRSAWNNSKFNGSQSILNNRNPNNTCSPQPKKIDNEKVPAK